MAFVRKIKTKSGVYLAEVESYREGGKVRQRVIRWIGRSDTAAVAPRGTSGSSDKPLATKGPSKAALRRAERIERYLDEALACLKEGNERLQEIVDRGEPFTTKSLGCSPRVAVAMIEDFKDALDELEANLAMAEGNK